jgi:hypothetical protein
VFFPKAVSNRNWMRVAVGDTQEITVESTTVSTNHCTASLNDLYEYLFIQQPEIVTPSNPTTIGKFA